MAKTYSACQVCLCNGYRSFDFRTILTLDYRVFVFFLTSKQVKKITLVLSEIYTLVDLAQKPDKIVLTSNSHD